MSSQSDATPTYRGYRRQILYTLHRILESSDDAYLVFHPESVEDLAICGADNKLLEIIQVKDYSSDLTLSSFSPDKPGSFFYRVVEELIAFPDMQINIASFGRIGVTLTQAFETDGPERSREAKKLSGYGFISESDAMRVLARIQPVFVEEDVLEEQIYERLRNSLTIDPDYAFDTLHFWLYLCAENKVKITRQEIIERINKVGQCVAERATYHKEWGTAIVPIRDRELEPDLRSELTDEFYRGVSARYDHILADLDILRHQKMQEIANAFEANRVVIVHGASGQGKTTLAYRYLHENFPDYWRFKVQLVEDRKHALSIATALIGQADAIGIPLAIYLDVTPKDRDWPELVKQLAPHQNIQVLVTVREEDWRRASVSGAEIQFAGIELSFEKSEAQEIYGSLTAKQTSSEFLSFEEAWRKFGEDGPLMEFVYLVTQGGTLRERLLQQVRRLEDEVTAGIRERQELDFLIIVSVVSAFEAQLRVELLVEHLGLPVPRRTFEIFEKEYHLLKFSPDESLVTGLHPIRSTILADILTTPPSSTWLDSAVISLPFIYEPDVEVFLLHAFSQHWRNIKPLLNALMSYQPNQWNAIAGATRALIWLGLREYTEANRQLIEEAVKDAGSGWTFVLDFDIADVSSGQGTSWWKALDFLSQERKEKIANFQARQTDKKLVFNHTTTWLTKRTQQPLKPMSDTDWSEMAEVIFWLGYLNINWPFGDWLSGIDFDNAINELSLEILADVSLGLSSGYSEQSSSWLETNRARLVNRFCQETQTVVLEDDGRELIAHFIFDIERVDELQSESKQYQTTNLFHSAAMQRVELLRKLFPDREIYGCRGYGHRIIELPFEDTHKNIPKSNLNIRWLISVNSTFRGIAVQFFRPEMWQEYAQSVFAIRQNAIPLLKQLERSLKVYFRKQKFVQLIGGRINVDSWIEYLYAVQNPPLLPKCALDEWGFVDESISDAFLQELQESSSRITSIGLVVQEYKTFLAPLRKYTLALSNFLQQSLPAMAYNAVLGRKVSTEAQKAELEKMAEEKNISLNAPRLSTYNLGEAIKVLPKMQREFRQLLGHFFDANELTRLERKEKDMLNRLWSMWYFFAFHPHRVIQNSLKKLSKRPENVLKQMRKNIRREFRQLSSDTQRVNIASENILWDDQPALWVTIDGKDALDVYNCADEVIMAIRAAIGKVEATELRRYVLDFHWPHLVIVPLIRGKCLTPTAWRILMPSLLSTKEFKIWQLAHHTIPSDAFSQLGFSTWTVPRLEIATNLLQGAVTLSHLTIHIRDLKELPDVDDQGEEQLQAYMSRLSNHISEAFQLFLGSASRILDEFNNLPASEQEYRPNLIAAVQAISEMHQDILPTSDFQGKTLLTLEDLYDWADRLEQGQEYAVLIWLNWATDILDNG